LLAKLALLANTLQKLMYPTHNYTNGIMATFKIFRFFKKHPCIKKKFKHIYKKQATINMVAISS
jgi:hypothetical protein